MLLQLVDLVAQIIVFTRSSHSPPTHKCAWQDRNLKDVVAAGGTDHGSRAAVGAHLSSHSLHTIPPLRPCRMVLQLVDLVARIMALVPPWVRIYRIQRDIPMPLVTSGVEKGNLRELALARMGHLGLKCRDVRTREAGIQDIHHQVCPQVSDVPHVPPMTPNRSTPLDPNSRPRCSPAGEPHHRQSY